MQFYSDCTAQCTLNINLIQPGIEVRTWYVYNLFLTEKNVVTHSGTSTKRILVPEKKRASFFCVCIHVFAMSSTNFPPSKQHLVTTRLPLPSLYNTHIYCKTFQRKKSPNIDIWKSRSGLMLTGSISDMFCSFNKPLVTCRLWHVWDRAYTCQCVQLEMIN